MRLATSVGDARRIRRTINPDNHHLHNRYVLMVFVLSTSTLCHSLYTCDTCFAQCTLESLQVGCGRDDLFVKLLTHTECISVRLFTEWSTE